MYMPWDSKFKGNIKEVSLSGIRLVFLFITILLPGTMVHKRRREILEFTTALGGLVL